MKGIELLVGGIKNLIVGAVNGIKGMIDGVMNLPFIGDQIRGPRTWWRIPQGNQ